MDRITQLQDRMEMLGKNFVESIGFLQDHAEPQQLPGYNLPFPEPKKPPVEGKTAIQFHVENIIRSVKETHLLIDSLPSIESSSEQQIADLEVLEELNKQAAERLEAEVKKGEEQLRQLRVALRELADCITAEVLDPAEVPEDED
eukprot:comp4537_c0_seq1/m.760 comp4537_c0_seq1/g.760  ORF comp4537_c0_seq1/g.760 comp4537_c0_seq1/m.760 type:complete len:145 (-) comp4537_c0_seq1:551-985(-)